MTASDMDAEAIVSKDADDVARELTIPPAEAKRLQECKRREIIGEWDQ